MYVTAAERGSRPALDGTGGRRVVAVRASYEHVDEMVEHIRPLLAHDVAVVVVLGAPGRVDLALLDALARLALSARRCGGELHVRADAGEVEDLAVLTGLAGVLRFASGSGQP